MDSFVAIAKHIADLDTAKEVKDSLRALFNLELSSSSGDPVTKASYIREVEQRFESWTPQGEGGAE